MHFTYFFLFFSLTCTCCVKETWSTHTKTPFWDTHTNYPCGPHHRPWDDCKTTTTTTTTTNKQTTTTTTTTTTNSKLLSTLITKSSPSYFPTTAHDTTAHSTTAHSTTAASFKSTSKVNYPSSSLVPSTTTSDFHQQEVATG